MKNLLKKVMMVLTCFIIFMTNVNVVGVIKNIDVSGLFRKMEDRSNEVGATDLPSNRAQINLTIKLFEPVLTKNLNGEHYLHDREVEVRTGKNNNRK